MKIIVLVKQTPDTEAYIKLSSDGKSLDSSGFKYIINPYDEYAIEEALKIKSKSDSSEVVLVSLGEEMIKDALLKGLAMGADRAICIRTENMSQMDSFLVAKVLSQVCQQEKADIVLCGKQGIDNDDMHVGVMVAEMLDYPHVNTVCKLEVCDNHLVVEREIEGGQVERYEASLPCVIGAHKSLNNPRYASLPGIMKAKRKPMEHKTLKDFGLEEKDILENSKTKVVSYNLPPKKSKGKIFKNESVDSMVEQVVKLLREESKVI